MKLRFPKVPPGARAEAWGAAFLDITTGEFFVALVDHDRNLQNLVSEIAKYRPAECIVPSTVPDELVLSAYLIGTESMVRERIAAYARAGVGCLRIGAHGRTAAEQIGHLEMVSDLVRGIA